MGDLRSEWEREKQQEMGNCCQGPPSEYSIYIRTGDRKNAGTDANVRIILHDDHGHSSEEITLDNFLRNDFERGALDQFEVRIVLVVVVAVVVIVVVEVTPAAAVVVVVVVLECVVIIVVVVITVLLPTMMTRKVVVVIVRMILIVAMVVISTMDVHIIMRITLVMDLVIVIVLIVVIIIIINHAVVDVVVFILITLVSSFYSLYLHESSPSPLMQSEPISKYTSHISVFF